MKYSHIISKEVQSALELEHNEQLQQVFLFCVRYQLQFCLNDCLQLIVEQDFILSSLLRLI